LGLTRAGFDHAWFCEIDPFARRILAAHWPGVPIVEDVAHVTAKSVQPVDVLVGGFPCQDVSCAGHGKGIVIGTRSGLWYEYLRIIRELRPRFVVIENVKALLARGIGTVLAGLAESGYDAVWDVLPAAAFGAPHLRERVVVVAYARGVRQPEFGPLPTQQKSMGNRKHSDGQAYWNGLRLAGPRAQAAVAAHRRPIVCRMDDGGPASLDRLRVLGNGIVPDLMEHVGRMIRSL